MAPTIASTVVDRPAAEVFAYATDPACFHEWQQGVIDGHLDRPGPAQVGTKCLTTRRIGGANRAVTSALTHIDAPRTWGVQGIDGPIRATVDVTVEPLTETSSRLIIAVDFDGHGIGKLLVPSGDGLPVARATTAGSGAVLSLHDVGLELGQVLPGDERGLAGVRSAHLRTSKLANVSVLYVPVTLAELAVDSCLEFLMLSMQALD